jgi:hypothetical protein
MTTAEGSMHPFVQAIADADISKESKRQYLRSLETLKRMTGGSFEEIVRSPKTVYARIEKDYENNHTRKALVNSVKALFRHVGGLKDAAPNAFETWHKKYTELERVIADKEMSMELTNREKEAWVPWADVVHREQQLATEDFGSFDHLLLAMYCLIEPLRQDFGNVRIFRASPAYPQTYEKHNYMVIQPTSGELVLNKYKTSRKYKTLLRPIPEGLLRIIHASLRTCPREYLFIDDRGLPYVKKNSYTKYSNRILQKLFGKRVTVSTLRHSYISSIDFNASTPRDLFQASRNMGHSIATQQLYRRKPESPAIPSTPPPPPPTNSGGGDIVVTKEGGEGKKAVHSSRDSRFVTITW